MPEYGRCKINISNNGKVGKQHLRASSPARQSLLFIAANSEPELKLIESPSNSESQPWLQNHHSYHNAEAAYSPSQMSTYLPLYMMKSCFCRVSKPSFSSVSRSFVHHNQPEFDRKALPKAKASPGYGVYITHTTALRCIWILDARDPRVSASEIHTHLSAVV